MIEVPKPLHHPISKYDGYLKSKETSINNIPPWYPFFLIFGGHGSFLWATDTPVLDFWWHLLWVSKPEWEALFALTEAYVLHTPWDSTLVWNLLNSWLWAMLSGLSRPLLAFLEVLSLRKFWSEWAASHVKSSLKSSTQDHIWSRIKGVSGMKHFCWVQPPVT